MREIQAALRAHRIPEASPDEDNKSVHRKEDEENDVSAQIKKRVEQIARVNEMLDPLGHKTLNIYASKRLLEGSSAVHKPASEWKLIGPKNYRVQRAKKARIFMLSIVRRVPSQKRLLRIGVGLREGVHRDITGIHGGSGKQHPNTNTQTPNCLMTRLGKQTQ